MCSGPLVVIGVTQYALMSADVRPPDGAGAEFVDR